MEIGITLVSDIFGSMYSIGIIRHTTHTEMLIYLNITVNFECCLNYENISSDIQGLLKGQDLCIFQVVMTSKISKMFMVYQTLLCKSSGSRKWLYFTLDKFISSLNL